MTYIRNQTIPIIEIGLSLNITFVRFAHLAVCVYVVCSFYYRIVIHSSDELYVSNHSSTAESLCIFQCGLLTNRTVVNIYLQIYSWKPLSISLDFTPKRAIAVPYREIIFTFEKDCQTIFHFELFYILTSNVYVLK